MSTELVKRTAPCTKQTLMNSVRYLELTNKNSLLSWTSYFPNVTELTFKAYPFEENKHISPHSLHRVFPLNQITRLSILGLDLYLRNFLRLITQLPNIHTLRFSTELLIQMDLDNIQYDTTFHIASTTNKVKSLQADVLRTLDQIKLLVNLFQRLEQINICLQRDYSEEILQYLLMRNNDKIRHLHSLLILTDDSTMFQKIMNLIQSEKRLVDCVNGGNAQIRLWW